MKKILTAALAAVLMLAGTNAFAQLSVGAGWLNSTLSAKVINKTLGVNEKASDVSNGLYVGASYNIPIAGGFGIAPGVYYSMVAGRADNYKIGTINIATGTFSEHAANIPINLNWGYGINDVKFLVFAGPTLQFGLSSKYKINTIGGNGEINCYKDCGDFNMGRFNVYLGGGVGAEIANTIQITVGFDYGMIDLFKDKDLTGHRYNIKLGAAYIF